MATNIQVELIPVELGTEPWASHMLAGVLPSTARLAPDVI